MKLSLYRFMACLTMVSLTHGMDPSSASTTKKVTKALNASNTQTSQEVCRLTLCAIAEKRLQIKKTH